MIVRWLVPCSVALLLGCSSNGSSGNPDFAGAADFTVVPDLAYYLPQGYASVPFLSDMPTHTFAMPDMVLAQGMDYLAVIETNAGRMVVDLLEAKAPTTVNSFVFLALHHYFDGVAFHYVTAQEARGGDPNTLSTDKLTWGKGGPGYTIPLEINDPKLMFDLPGVVGMWHDEGGEFGSEFFITQQTFNTRNGIYTVFAKVTEGMEVLPRIVKGMPPALPTRMARVYIVAK